MIEVYAQIAYVWDHEFPYIWVEDNQLVRRWVLKCLQSANWSSVPDLVEEHLRFGWSGLNNSKLIEDGNKIQRDHERGVPNRELSSVSGWHALTSKELLKSYQRPEVCFNSLQHVPADFDFDSLFQKEKTLPEDDRKFLGRVKQKCDWPTFTPESEQMTFVNLALLDSCRRSNDWAKAETAWFSALLPEGCAVTLPGHSPVLVVRTYTHGALTWPLVWRGEYLTIDPTVQSLYWVHLNSLEAQVMELEVHSPARRGVPSSGIGLKPLPPTDLLAFQQSRAFAGVKDCVGHKSFFWQFE